MKSSSHKVHFRVVRAVVVIVFAAMLVSCSAASAKQSASEETTSEATTSEQVTTTTAIPTTTTTALKRAIAGSQLSPGPNTIYVLGDSVTLGAQSQIPAALPSWKVTFDAKESRRIDQGDDLLAGRSSPIARVLVVHLCTNWGGGDFRAAAAKLMNAAKGVERVVWVTCYPWLPAVDSANAVITALPSEYPNVLVVDWASAAKTPGYTYDDHLHLKTPGAVALASLLSETVGPAPIPG